MAARAALRVVPVLADGLYLSPSAAMISTACHAIATAWLTAKYPSQALAQAAAAAARSAAAAAAAIRSAAAAATRSADAAYAAVCSAAAVDAAARSAAAADAAARSNAARSAAAASAATRSADAAAYAAVAGFWSVVEADASAIERGMAPARLAGMPLWPLGMSQDLSERWDRMKSALLADDPNWQVWTDWYQDRLAGDGAGRPLMLELEEKRVLFLSREDLEQGAAHCNAILAKIEAERPDGLTPDPSAGQFRGDEHSERISAERLRRDDRLSDDPVTEDLRQSAAEHAQDLLRIASSNLSSNRYDDASLATPAGRLVDALGEALAQVQPGRVVGQLIALEVHLNSDTEARKKEEPLDPILSRKAHDALLIAVDTLRILVQTDPHLGLLYAKRWEVVTPRIDPDQAAAVVDDADTSGIVAEDAKALLQDTAEADRKDPESTLGARTFANFLRVATRIGDWARRAGPELLAKAKLARDIAKWMIRNEAALVALSAFEPTLQRIVSATIQAVKKLPLD